MKKRQTNKERRAAVRARQAEETRRGFARIKDDQSMLLYRKGERVVIEEAGAGIVVGQKLSQDSNIQEAIREKQVEFYRRE